jgi:hypothetical protein
MPPSATHNADLQKRLIETLKELTAELGEWVEHHYKETKEHGLQRQYLRDMQPVWDAQMLLEEIKRDRN